MVDEAKANPDECPHQYLSREYSASIQGDLICQGCGESFTSYDEVKKVLEARRLQEIVVSSDPANPNYCEVTVSGERSSATLRDSVDAERRAMEKQGWRLEREYDASSSTDSPIQKLALTFRRPQ
jgi:hypothetical protein